jgi:predicted ABC-type ATPase
VAERVNKGGHNIPYNVIQRRYFKGIENLFNLFMKEVDIWAIYDNSDYERKRIAFGRRYIRTRINNKTQYNEIKKQNHSLRL